MRAALIFGVDLLKLRPEGRLRAGRRLCFRIVVFSAGLLQPGDFLLSGSQLAAQVIDQSH